MSSEQPRDLLIFADTIYTMEPNTGKESGEMYSPYDQGEYMQKVGVSSFSIKGLSDALIALDTEVTVVHPPSEEYVLLLEVTMADHPGHPCSPAFSQNDVMVMHTLKGYAALRDLKHVQVDGSGTAYLFFFDRQSHKGLTLDATQTLRLHVGEVFAEWISHSVHFAVILLLLVEEWCQPVAASEQCCKRSRVEYQGHPMTNLTSSESDTAPQLVGSTPPSVAWMSQAEETGGGQDSKVSTSRLRGRPPKPHPTKDGAGNSPPISLGQGGANSDGYSTVSEAFSTHHHRRRWESEKCLSPVCLDMQIFKLTDPYADVTYTLWRFDVQGRLGQYQEESMMPNIYASLWGYPGRWVRLLEDGPNLTVTELLEHMDCVFGDMHEYDTMIHSFHEIRQKEGESMEEYMLQIHKAVAVIHHTYPDQVTNQGKNLA